MVICAVVGCDSDSTKGKKVSLFRLPKDEKLKKIWITKLKRTNLPTEKNIRVCKEVGVCHLHFEESGFERDLKVLPLTLS